jgi:hypothetical protein
MLRSARPLRDRAPLRARTLLASLLMAIFAALLGSCVVTSMNLRVPASALAGEVFEIFLDGTGAQGGLNQSVGAVVQLPIGFIVESAAFKAANPVSPVVTLNDAALLATYTAEPGHYLAAFSRVMQSADPAALRLRIRAPSQPGFYTIKAGAATSASFPPTPWGQHFPNGTTSFSAISAPYAQVLSVVASSQGAPSWITRSGGLAIVAGANSHAARCSVDAADYDQDGRMDLLAAILGTLNSNVVELYRGVAVSGWSPVPAAQVPGSAPAITSSAVAHFGDFDADGFLDILNGSAVYFGDGAGNWSPFVLVQTPTTSNLPPAPTDGAAGDLNGDGIDDVAVAGTRVAVYVSNGNRTFTPALIGLPTTAISPNGTTDIEILDVDGDLDRDLLLLGPAGVDIFLNNGSAQWTHAGSAGIAYPTQYFKSAADDVDGDGDADLVLTGLLANTQTQAPTQAAGLSLYRRQGTQYVLDALSGLPSGGSYSCATFSDIDGDGAQDLVAVRADLHAPGAAVFGGIEIWRKIGSVFQRASSFERGLPFMGSGAGGGIVVRDLDGDGLGDIAVGTIHGPCVYTRVGRAHTARYGTVGGASGPIEVLTVNGSAGDPTTHAVAIGLNQPVTVSMAQSPALATPSRFAMWGRLGQPTAISGLEGVLGEYSIVPQFLGSGDPALFTVANTYDPLDPFALIPWALPGAFSFTSFAGAPFPLLFTLQGIIDDPSANAIGLAITNEVVVDIR